MGLMYKRKIYQKLKESLLNRGEFLQILTGPRQVGKTTLARQLQEEWPGASVYAAADVIPPPGPEWIETHWIQAKRKSGDKSPCLLILDEIQKVRGWSTTLKHLWDSRDSKHDIRVLCLGSSALLLQSGITETLAGRFLKHKCYHWGFSECQEAFGWSLEEWLYFGGYPGAAVLKDDEEQWKQYIMDSLIETAIAKDVVQMEPIRKPALLRNLFGLAAVHPAEILSYNKMLGQLQEAGNTTTLAHYLYLLETAFLISGLELFSPRQKRKRGSSPKLVVWNNALISAQSLRNFQESCNDRAWWGRVVENACLAHAIMTAPAQVAATYWREGNAEVDLVLAAGERVTALEIKSGRADKLPGLNKFRRKYPSATALVIGSGGIPLEEFLKFPVTEWLGKNKH